jgi:hypothetical protein
MADKELYQVVTFLDFEVSVAEHADPVQAVNLAIDATYPGDPTHATYFMADPREWEAGQENLSAIGPTDFALLVIVGEVDTNPYPLGIIRRKR